MSGQCTPVAMACARSAVMVVLGLGAEELEQGDAAQDGVGGLAELVAGG
jgi:hypothetical protein